MRIAFLTLGCKVNYFETEKMIADFRKNGYSIVDFEEEAEVYVVNTCTVTNIADRKSRQMLHRARKKAPHALIVAVGCYVESAGASIAEEKAVDIAYGNREKTRLAELVGEELEKRFRSRQKLKEDETKTTQTPPSDTHHRRTRAFLKVQDGCNQFCSYCLIPYVRGRGELTSTPPEEVEREVRRRVEEGCREIVLTGIHLSSYGVSPESAAPGSESGARVRADAFIREEGKPLLELIRRVNAISGVERIRLGSLEPRIITEGWLEGLKTVEKLCPHFHLSLQSGCDETLARMNRHYTTEDFFERTELLRKVFDRPALTTDLIVGFPGETEEEFAETLEFLEKVGFADLHIFQYSMRDGTRAAAMGDQISPEEKKRRSEELLSRVSGWRSDYIRQQEKEEQRILFEETILRDGVRYLTGYNERYVRYGVEEGVAAARRYVPGECFSVPSRDRSIF